jgi:hypothetical protein
MDVSGPANTACGVNELYWSTSSHAARGPVASSQAAGRTPVKDLQSLKKGASRIREMVDGISVPNS